MGAKETQPVITPTEKNDVDMVDKESSSPTTKEGTNTESTDTNVMTPLKKIPFKDSVLVYIPMSVTADLGIAMRRTRTKRLAKLRKLYPALMESLESSNATANQQDPTESAPDPTKDPKNGDDNLEEKNTLSTSMTSPSTSKDTTKSTKVGKHDNVPRREQYASVLDYLEAKYVRGVMLDDIDEKIQKKKDLKKQQRQEKKLLMKKKKRKKKLLKLKKKKMIEQKGENGEGQEEKEGGGEDEDRSLGSLSSQGSNLGDIDDADLDISEDDVSDKEENLDDDDDDILSESDDGTGSCYSETSGFLDDTLLRTSVAEQVMASSFYGATRLQAESKKSSKKLENDEEEENLDDGFFVNVGNLEMVDGFDDTEAADIDFDLLDTLNNPKKKTKSKKKDKDNTNSKEKDKGGKPDGGNGKTKKSSTSDKKKSKGSSKTANKSPTNDKVLGNDEPISALKKKRKNPSSAGTKGVGSTKKKIKKISLSSSVKSNKSSTNSLSSKSSNDGSDTKTKKSEQKSKKGTEEVTLPPEIQEIREQCNLLKKDMKRLYQKVVKEVKKMPPENFPPKKKRKKETIKVSITIPQNKKPGDEIQFQNPRVPGQRLKVQVPENGVPGKSFVVSVPVPSKPTQSQNSSDGNIFSKEAKEILDQYSKAYDDWIEMEAKYHETAPDGNRKYKPNNERLKKFEKLLSFFPKDLLEPIDAAYLRKVVRRSRQNRSKRLKTQQLQQSLSSPSIVTSSLAKGTSKEPSETVLVDLTDKTSENVDDESNKKKLLAEGPTKLNNLPKKQQLDQDQEFFTLNIPRKGTEFPLITFDQADFSHRS